MTGVSLGRLWRMGAWLALAVAIANESFGATLMRAPLAFSVSFLGMAFSLAGVVAAAKAGERRFNSILPVYATTLFMVRILAQAAMPPQP